MALGIKQPPAATFGFILKPKTKDALSPSAAARRA
jgi:hypothetical protein